MICYVLAMGKQHLGPNVVVGYGIKIFWPGLFITSPDHLDDLTEKLLVFWKTGRRGEMVATPYIGYIGMCGPKGYGFSAVLVINRVSILADFGHFGHK